MLLQRPLPVRRKKPFSVARFVAEKQPTPTHLEVVPAAQLVHINAGNEVTFRGRCVAYPQPHTNTPASIRHAMRRPVPCPPPPGSRLYARCVEEATSEMWDGK